MTFEQLEFIVEVKRRGTILAAANSLNLSHPGISKAITNLEAEIGVNIFLRSRAGTTVTPEGELIIQMAQEILEKADEIRQLSAGEPLSGVLHVEAFPIDSMFFLPRAISEFRGRYGKVELMISQAPLTDILADLINQKIDLGLLALMQVQRARLSPDIMHRTLISSEMVIACSPQAQIAQKEFVTPEEIIHDPFVLHSDPLILKSLESLFSPLGLPESVMKTNDNTLIKQMVADGKALSIYTGVLGRNEALVKQGKLVLVPLKCRDDMQKVDFVFAHHRKKRLSLSDQAFLSYLKSAAQSAELRDAAP